MIAFQAILVLLYHPWLLATALQLLTALAFASPHPRKVTPACAKRERDHGASHTATGIDVNLMVSSAWPVGRGSPLDKAPKTTCSQISAFPVQGAHHPSHGVLSGCQQDHGALVSPSPQSVAWSFGAACCAVSWHSTRVFQGFCLQGAYTICDSVCPVRVLAQLGVETGARLHGQLLTALNC